MKGYVSTGAIKIEDNCMVMTVANYSATAIADKSALMADQTNMDTTQGVPAVSLCTTASTTRCGIAKGAIPAATLSAGVTIPGIGQMVVAGITRALAASGTWTAGNQVAGVTGGTVSVSGAAGQYIGYIFKTESVATTTPLVVVAFS